MSEKPAVTIDGRQYVLEDLSADAQSHLTNIQVTDQEIGRLQTRLAIFQTARNTYAQALQAALPKN